MIWYLLIPYLVILITPLVSGMMASKITPYILSCIREWGSKKIDAVLR
jgi:hypothetical protein